jgi:hypothetical protein
MKKILLISLPAIIMLLLISCPSNGQLVKNNVQLSGQFTVAKNADSLNSSRYAGRVNPAVVRNFMKAYRGASNETWLETPEGFVAMFRQDDIDYQVSYDKKGNVAKTIRSYTEAKLSPNLRHVVKSSYYDYDINLIQEIETPVDSLTYIIHLVGKAELIDLAYTDGELQVLQKFKRSE